MGRRLTEGLTAQLGLRTLRGTGLQITGENIVKKKMFAPSLNLRPVSLTTWLR